MITFLPSVLFFCFALFLFKVFHKLWWTPARLKSAFTAQGIKGPSYRFFHGNTKEISRMRDEARDSSMELTHNIFPRLMPHVSLWVKIYGKNFVGWHGCHPQIYATDPNLVKEILTNKYETFHKPEFPSYVKRIFGDGLVSTKGEKWSKQRKLANHAFHGDNLKCMVPTMIVSVETMLEKWRQHDGKEIDVSNEFRILTSEVISRTAFGSSYLEGEDIFKMLMGLTILLQRNVYKVRVPGVEKFLKTKDDIEAEKLEQGIRDSILKMIKKREEEAEMDKVDIYGSDYLGILIKAYRDADKTKQISIEDLIDECKTFYIAGHETTTSLLTWTVFLLAIYRDWQEKARQEVLEVFGQQNPTSDGITKLKTMNIIVNETLRLYTPIVNIVREVPKGITLGSLHLPAKMEVLIPSVALHHDPEIWGEDVHLFKPERFAEGVAKATKNNIAAFLPFALGPRNCVGMNFALTEVKIALSMILQRYRFTLSPNYVHAPVTLIATSPKFGLPVTLQALQNQTC